jgi:hypothetical protein
MAAKLKLVAENPRNVERVRTGQLPIYFAFVNFGSVENNRTAFQTINGRLFRNLPLRLHINRDMEDGTSITTDVRLTRHLARHRTSEHFGGTSISSDHYNYHRGYYDNERFKCIFVGNNSA